MSNVSIELPPLNQLQQLLSLTEIDAALTTIAKAITQRYQQPLTVLCVMNGGLVTTGHLLPKLSMDVTLDYIHVSRYREQTTGTDLHWKRYPEVDLSEKTILLIDDIFDEGVTLSALHDYCYEQGAKEVVSVVLLTKQHMRQQTAYQPDYSALEIEDVYVFGFGLDYGGHYRNLPGIYCLESSSNNNNL